MSLKMTIVMTAVRMIDSQDKLAKVLSVNWGASLTGAQSQQLWRI